MVGEDWEVKPQTVALYQRPEERSYLGEKGRTERTLEANLRTLREYRRKDRAFKRAIAAFVEAEASQNDPLEGEPVDSNTEYSSHPVGELQSKLRKVIGG